MLRNIFLACLLAFFALEGYAQTVTEKIELKWEQQPRKYQLSEDETLHYWYFENADYDQTKPQVPLFSQQFSLPTYGTLSARLTNAQYVPLENNANIDLEAFDEISAAIDVQTAVSFARRKPIGVVHFIPVRKNPATNTYERLVSADLQWNLTPSSIPTNSNGRSFTTNSALSSGQIFKVAVTSTGIQKLDYNFLQNLGVPVNNIDPRNIQILGNGGRQLPERMDLAMVDDLQENAILVAGEGDGSFDANDYILFYGVGTKNWNHNDNLSCGEFEHSTNSYTDESYYFIKIASTPGKRISTRNSVNASYTTNSYDALIHHEIDQTNLMEEEFALPPSGREWYGESFKITRTRNFNFTFNNRIESEPITIRSDLAVRVFSPGTTTMKANGTLLGPPQNTPVTTIYIYSDYAKRLRFPCYNPVLTGQSIDLEIQFNHPSSSVDMWVNYLSLQARSQLSFTGGQMDFRDTRTLGQGAATYQLSNASNVNIWDVSDPANVVIQGYSGTNTLTFGADASIIREFVAFDDNQFYVPLDRGTVANQNLHAITSPPDAIFVVHSSLRAQADRLAAHRRTYSNMTVEVVNVEDIYNEFSSGMPDVTAIRNFAKMLYERETPTEKLTHLLLFGIGTFDYKSLGNGRNSTNNPNLVPVYETQESMHPINTYTSDDYFALLDDNETMSAFGLLDLAVGRLPAANVSEATIMVDKIIQYDTNPSYMRDWRNRICFLGDDEDNNLHFYDTEGVSISLEQQDSIYNVDKIYLDAFPQVSTSGGERYPAAKAAFLDILFKGTFAVNYFGHGGEDTWAQERVFTSSDINNLSNGSRLPLFITATCSFGPHDDPSAVSAGEFLLLNPNGGAISVLTTVRVVIASHNERLVRNTFFVLMQRKPDGSRYTSGELLQVSKNNAAINPPVNSRKYALLGDPTMTLAYPDYNVKTTQIDGQPVTGQDTISALQQVTISGEITDWNGNKINNFNGTIYPTVFDKSDRLWTLGNDPGSFPDDFLLRKKTIFKGQASVVNGDFSFTFVVPQDINYTLGQGKISYYAENGVALDAHGYQPIIVGGSFAAAPQDNEGPEVLVYMNTEDFAAGGITDNQPKLLVKLYDDNGINTVGNSIGHDLTAQVAPINSKEQEYILNDFYESTKDDYRRGTALYQLKDLEPGVHTVRVKAWDVYNNPGEGSTEFVVETSADLALKRVLNYPNPFTTHTAFQFEHNLPNQSLDVQIQIYTVSGRLIKTIDHDIEAESNNGYRVTDITWDGRDDYGEEIAKGVYIYKVFVQSQSAADDQAKKSSEFQKLVILK